MIVKLTKMTPILFAGAAAAAIAAAPLAGANPPPPPPCLNPDGTPCASIGNVNAGQAGGADVNVPNGPQGTADNSGATGSLGPNGPGGSADRSGASGCWPTLGCISIPAP